jgi:hypothetical protein
MPQPATRVLPCDGKNCTNRAHGAWVWTFKTTSDPLPGDTVLEEKSMWVKVGKSRVRQASDGSYYADRTNLPLHQYTIERIVMLCAECGFRLGGRAKLIKSISTPVVPQVVKPERILKTGKTKSETLNGQPRPNKIAEGVLDPTKRKNHLFE